MNTELLLPKQRQKYIELSRLIIWGFYTAFYPRVLMLVKVPVLINFVHLFVVPWACLLAFTKTKVRDKSQILLTKEIIIAIIIFFGVNVASALVNKAGLVNVVLNFLLFCEQFLVLAAIISLPMIPEKLAKFRSHFILAGFINLFFALAQEYVFNVRNFKGGSDNIKGVFIAQGAGHVIGASISLTFALYYLFNAKKVPIWIRITVALASFWHVILADAKQVILVFGIAWVFLLLTKFKNVIQAIKYLAIALILGGIFIWCMQNLEEFRAFNIWLRGDIYGPDGEATKLKIAPFVIITQYYKSFLNVLFGVGPGHTVGRLGSWMIRDYSAILMPLGATRHPSADAVWDVVWDSWLGDKTSMFAPQFGWAAIWGDLGYVGLISFVYIWLLVWQRVCVDDVSRFLVLCIFSFGLVFTQMEEPGYMLYVVCLIAIQWHERHLKKMNYPNLDIGKTKPTNPKSLKGWIKRLLLTD